MKKIILLTTIFVLSMSLQAYAVEPTIHYVLNNEGVKNGIVIDQSGNNNNGETDSIVEEGDTFGGSVNIPIEPFVNCETFTWSGVFYNSIMSIPKIFNAESDKGYFSINGAGGSGMIRIFQYSLRDTINSIYEGAMYYDNDIYRDGQCHEYTLVQNQGYMSFYVDGQKNEPVAYANDETTSVTLKYILSGENPQMQLDCSGIRMKEFKMFDTALSEEEVSKIYKDDNSTPEPTSTIEPTTIPTETPVVTVEPTVAPTEEPKTEISLCIDNITEEGIMNCTVHNNIDEDIISDCIVAVYDSKNELKGIKVINGVPQGDTALEVDNCSDISMVKVFLWDSLAGMKPQIEKLTYFV